jgi:hypothetical protein
VPVSGTPSIDITGTKKGSWEQPVIEKIMHTAVIKNSAEKITYNRPPPFRADLSPITTFYHSFVPLSLKIMHIIEKKLQEKGF